ncbi:MAG: M56 family metallopeptidase [Anaerovoracaceae bacterium]
MIDTIISSSVLILIILTIRFVFKGKLNPMVQYSLWSLVALRLAVFNLFALSPVKSAFSIMNAVGSAEATIREASNVGQVLAGHAEAEAIDNAVLVMDNVKTGVMVSGEGISAAAAIDWQLVLMIIWAVGSIAIVLWLTHVNRKFGKKIFDSRQFLMSVRADENGKLVVDEKGLIHPAAKIKETKLLSVYIVEGLDSPCLMGYKGETAIYVPSQVAADQEKLRFAIAHELCHYWHHDLAWAIVRGALLAFYWFNPLVWVAAIISKRDCELACDYSVLKEMGKKDRLAYGRTLVDLIRQSDHKSDVLQMATTMYGTTNGIKERITLIAKNRKMKTSTLVVVLLIALLAVGCTFTAAPDGGVEDSGNEVMIASKAQYEEAYGLGFPDFTELAATYQAQADDSAARKEIMEDPVTAAIAQLNLVNEEVTGTYQDSYGEPPLAVVKFAWEDGEVEVNLIQPTYIDEIGAERQASVWIVVNEDSGHLEQISAYMKEQSEKTFSPYYELLDFVISNYQEELVNGNTEAIFNYKIVHKNYDKDPDTVGYIKEAKDSGNINYQQMYDEYLQPQDMNFHLKVVIDENDFMTLYSNISPVGIEWEETGMSDFILK